jgi:hypothetical protein
MSFGTQTTSKPAFLFVSVVNIIIPRNLFKPPAALKNAKKDTKGYLFGRRPTDLLFFVFFVSFVVNAFFTARFAQERKERKERRKDIFFARRATNLFFFASFAACIFLDQ